MEVWRKKAAKYEDSSEPREVGIPLMIAIGAAAILGGAYFMFRPKGQRAAGDNENEIYLKKGKQPTSLAELRHLRAEAAEARKRRDDDGQANPGISRLTPLGQAIAIAQLIDALQTEVENVEAKAQQEGSLTPAIQEEQKRLSEVLMQRQLTLDAIQAYDGVRPIRKAQTIRIQELLMRLEKLC